MPLLLEEARAYRLVPFIRAWANSDEKWNMFAILCSLFTRARYVAGDTDGAMAQQWIEHKPYPPTVINYVSQLPMPRVESLNSAFDKAQLLFHDWIWETTHLLEEEDRVTLRAMKAVVLDFALLLRAATVSKRNKCTAPVDPMNVEALFTWTFLW